MLYKRCKHIRKGKKIIITIIVFILLIDIITTVIISSLYTTSGMHQYATYKLIQGIIRLLLTGTMLYFLYKGQKWAKWLTAILFSLGGLIGVISLLDTFNLFMLLLGIADLGIGITLIASRSVKDFLRYQKGETKIVESISDDYRF